MQTMAPGAVGGPLYSLERILEAYCSTSCNDIAFSYIIYTIFKILQCTLGNSALYMLGTNWYALKDFHMP